MKSPKKTKKTVFLEEVHIKNFLSLRDVVLPLKSLTVLVGPNASGKSNILRALWHLTAMMNMGDLPTDFMQESIWAGKSTEIRFRIGVKIGEVLADYKLELDVTDKTQINVEELIIDKLKVISVYEGEGEVTDEDGKNITSYKPAKPKLALKSASDYGNKPVTSALSEFIQDWKFYDFKPYEMRISNILYEDIKVSTKSPDLDIYGLKLKNILLYWLDNDKKRLESVNKILGKNSERRITEYNEGKNDLYLSEGCEKLISLKKASDGTMRLLAYHVLLNHPHIPSLIAIEEPERNLHPAALKEIASVLERLSERTQVIITTHSSQLLDAFNPENLSSGKMGVLMLQNIPGKGTQIKNLEEIRKDREALDGWIADFGIGSAIFDSELLQDITESQSCQA